jgi:maleylpyruvate isomerase
VTANPQHDLGLVRESADQLVHDVGLLSTQTLAAPSLLPGWTRAHVVGHLIGNAEGLTRLLHWARTGEPTPQYPDQHRRDAGIQSAVGKPADVLADRLREAIDGFLLAADDLDDGPWSATVRLGAAAAGREIVAAELPWRRLVEQEVHNVDLDGAYTPAHWAPEFVHRLLHETVERYLDRPDVPALDLDAIDGDWSAVCGDPGQRVRVEGPSPALLAWLTGRSAGQGLHVHDAALPTLPAWF